MTYLSFAVVGLCVVAAIWLAIWGTYSTRRNNATAEFRHQLDAFVFQDKGDWEDRHAWLKSQPSYDEMCPTGLLAPVTSKPLRQMISGKYEEEFLRWRAGDMPTAKETI